jgi:mannose-6-phosphate isomerase
MMDKPVRLIPSLREKVWGRTSLAPWFPDAREPVGEAWYLLPDTAPPGAAAEQELPLLVKLIFTSERLSVQVHPDDGEGVPRGKTEMWHILEAEPDATIALGFREPVSRERLLESTRTGEIEQLLNWFPVKAGETYFTPAHTVHAIGAGIVLCEIQQHSDVTYRLWDYGRPREIHVEQAAPICDLGVHPGPAQPVTLGPGRELLVRSKHFVTESIRLEAAQSHRSVPHRCQLWICLEGSGTIEEQPIGPGEVWLMPDSRVSALTTDSGIHFLETFVPDPASSYRP